jgi:glycosyltransferase involved in cell wall biosynthesis
MCASMAQRKTQPFRSEPEALKQATQLARMKIAMLGLKGIPYPEGIENFTEQVASRLVQRGHEVTVYVRPYVGEGENGYYRGIRIRKLPSVNTKHLDAITHTFFATMDALRSDADVLHFHALGPSTFSIIPRLKGIKTIVQVHGLDWQREKWGRAAKLFLRTAEYTAAYFPHRTIVISQALQQYFERKYRRRFDYIPTGVETYEQRRPRLITQWDLDEGNYILFLGRLVPEKGCHYLLRAFDALTTPKKLVIAGDSSHSDEYVAQLKQSANAKVVFTGFARGELLEELFSNAYAYILPSELEGLPHSLLQALSFGKCVLASDIPANLEALGDCGLTFRSGDVEDLKQKLMFLLHHPEFTLDQKEKSQARVRQHYAWNEVVNRLERVYLECLSHNP